MNLRATDIVICENNSGQRNWLNTERRLLAKICLRKFLPDVVQLKTEVNTEFNSVT